MKNNILKFKKTTKIASIIFFYSLFLAAYAQDQSSTTQDPPRWINLSTTPLHSSTTMDKPTMALALSVEFPTVGAQYRQPDTSASYDDTYTTTKEYLGYYDSDACYRYIDNPSNPVSTGKTAADYKRFQYANKANKKSCSEELFSGNFLNWSSSSAIDMLRLALSGGDRYIDENNLTILQRAVLPNGSPSPSCFWNSKSYFPAKKLTSGSANDYHGAIPESMRTTANGKNVWIANTLNRIYFRAGDNSVGTDCNSSHYSSYTLGYVGSSQLAPSSEAAYDYLNKDNPDDSQFCSNEGENNICNFTGIKEVWFGKNGKWIRRPAYNGVACYYKILGDPASGESKKCYIKDYTGTWQPETNQLNSDGYFYSRVEVCTTSENSVQDPRKYQLCRQYPNGNYKPIGVIQKYSDNLRLAAFGYLMDHTDSKTTGRYGGVLRAPMKYVGPKTFDIYGREESTANSAMEWDPQTGIFYKNPNPVSGFSNSGVINYLNKFGRTGTTLGMYKQYDPVGELYYETLRYLQGLSPTPAAVSSISADHYDGFPAYTDWSNIDPYGSDLSGNNRDPAANYACLKSNIVVVGDVNTHDGDWRNIPNSDNLAENIPNFRTWYSNAITYEANEFQNSRFNQKTDRRQIIGYAYWAHANDIRGIKWNDTQKRRPGLRVKTFLFDVNENSTETNLNKREFENQFFIASKYGGYENDPNNIANKRYSLDEKPNYGILPTQATTTTPVKDDDIWKRHYKTADGTPTYDASTYYLQSDAEGVLSAFDEIFNRASSAAQSISQSAASTSSVNASSNDFVYTGTYDTGNWTGNVIAKKIEMDGISKNISLVPDTTWDPAARLNNKQSSARNIVIGTGSTTAAKNFLWDQIQNTDIATHLSKSSISAIADDLGPDRIDYLRGNRIKEGNNSSADKPFRTRSSLLGDIINAGVSYAGAPSNQFIDSSYVPFYNTNKDRLPIVVAGANDGMLHAFAAKSNDNFSAAEEVFAYIPSWLAPNLPALTSPTYIENHQAYVDAPSVIGEAQITFRTATATPQATDWKTVLVSGTGASGKGVFALDISNPENFSPSNVIWEFTSADDSDLGYVVGKPKILKFKTGIDNQGNPTYRWFAAVASGVNNYAQNQSSDATVQTPAAQPAIFLLALDKPTTSAWILGSNYYKINFPVDTTLSANMAPGIIDFSVLWARGGEVTHIYAGDLQGNLWKLDFTSTTTTSKYKSPDDWTLNKLSYFKKSGNPLPLYVAQNGDQNPSRQPISAAPTLVTGPIVNGKETFYVLFGTGKYLESSDVSNTDIQSFYVLFDDGDAAADSTSNSRIAAISGRARLAEAEVDTTAKTISAPSFVWGRPDDDNINNATLRAGWYFDYPESAERMVYSAEDMGQFNITFNTIVPSPQQINRSICTSSQASSNIYDINIKTGGGKYKVSQIGILGPSIFLQNEEKTTVSDIDSTGRAKRTVINERISVGSNGHAVDQTAPVVEMVGRLSWRQIYNYKQLWHNANPATGETPEATDDDPEEGEGGTETQTDNNGG